MAIQTLAHLSDLHIGRSRESDRVASELCAHLVASGIDHVVVSGDLTHRGRTSELARFEEIFAPLAGRLTIVPGNHDRLADEVGMRMMDGARVRVQRAQGLYLVQIDSTGPHNRFLLAAHGEICDRVLGEVDAALDAAPPSALVAITLHHHPLPLPAEGLHEKLSMSFGWPYAAELRLGPALLERAFGRCDLILHGHRHTPRAFSLGDWPRALGVYNAGSSTMLGAYRVFTHARGFLKDAPRWQTVSNEIRALAQGG